MPSNQLNFCKLVILVFMHLLVVNVFAQNGLGFASHEVVQDQRTGLSLFSKEPLCIQGDFELSFDLSFYPNQESYFGYITRIIDENGLSVDLVYDQDFRIVVGDKLSSIEFNIPYERLFAQWTHIKIGFDASKSQLTLEYRGKRMVEFFPLAGHHCYRIYFGMIDYTHFASTDVPAMKIKDIRIDQGRKNLYHWPLNERSGAIAQEQRKKATAIVNNPLWVNKLHYDWQLLKSFSSNGNASFAFDPTAEMIFLVGADSLVQYNLLSQKKEVTPYASGRLHLPDGNQSIYDTITHTLINFDVDQRKAMKFNWQTNGWSDTYAYPAEKTNHGHANKFISSIDTSLYVLGGYGNFSYKNDVHRYDIKKADWELIDSQANNLTPHYLAALGTVSGGAYILGGYGSVSGKQVLNPKNFYDLVYFDVKKRTFSKKMVLKVLQEDFVFANSLVIDEQKNSFYALIFPKHRFRSHLQLIKGSLHSAQYEVLGNKLSYQFSDAHSFADLYYSSGRKQFIAITSYFNQDGTTQVQIYGLSNPPLLYNEDVSMAKKSIIFVWIIVMGLLGALCIIIYYIFKRRKHNSITIYKEAIDHESPVIPKPQSGEEKEPVSVKIYLFGDFSLINSQGDDITKYFTPLLKELFLLILLYTLRWEKGISSDKLIELLWYDKSDESARNNRSANIAKLKHLLDRFSDIKLQKEGNHWRLTWPNDAYIDYHCYLSLIQHKKADKALILSCSEITKRGSFLSGIEYEWLDAFKSEVSTKIVSTYLQQMQILPIDHHADLLISLANEVFLFDPVNEEAVIIKCKSLASIGQHSQAAHAFESFCKEYEMLYGEKFERDFKRIMAN